MSQQSINLGTADSGNGDPLRVAFDKVNDNFAELYSSVIASGVASTSASPPVSPGQGDLWWDTNDGNLYVYYSGVWTSANAGSQGPQGAVGPQGLEGPAGIRGLKGNTGDIGPRGFTGETGAQGEVGPRGLKGDQGDAGANGLDGAQGIQGVQGEVGPRGLKGDQGEPGPAGTNGVAGEQGIQGEQGPRGVKGDTGEPGTNGSDGADGQPGPQGEQGPRGLAGADGADGEPGPQGDPGTQVQFSLTAPNPVTEGNVWWNMNDGNLYVHYNNQWVSAVSIAGLNSTNELVNGAYTASLGTDGSLTLPPTGTLSAGTIYFNGSLQTGSQTQYQFEAIVTGEGEEAVYSSKLSLPNIAEIFAGEDLSLSTWGSGVAIKVRNPSDFSDHTWSFGNNGKLTIPSGLAFGGSNGYAEITNTSPDASLYIVNTGLNQLVVEWTAGNNQLPVGEDVQTAGIYAGVSGLNIGLLNDQDVSHSWQFAGDGSLRIPGDIRSLGNINIDIDPAGPTLQRWTFGTDGITTFPNNTTISDDLTGEYSNTFLCVPWGYTGGDAGLFSSNNVTHPYFNPLIATVTVGWYVSGPLLNGVKEITEIVEQGNGDRAFIVDLTDGSTWADVDITIPYRFYTPDYALVYNGTRLTVDSNEWNFTQAGDLTIPGNINEKAGNGLEISVHNNRNNDGTPGSALLSLTNNDVVNGEKLTQLDVGAYSIELSTDYTGVFTGARRTWEFDRDGVLTFPDATTYTGKGITVPVDQSLTVNLSFDSEPSNINTSFKVNPLSIKLPTGNGNIFSNGETAAERWSLDSANKTFYFPDAGDGVSPQIRYSTPGNDGMQLFTAAKPIKITTASNTNWTFGTDGNLTLPEGTTISDTSEIVAVTLDQFTDGGYPGTQVFNKVSDTLYELSPGGPYMTLISAIWRLKISTATYYDSTDLISWGTVAGGLPAPVGTLTRVSTMNLTVGSKVWAFGGDGRTTFPVATVPLHSFGAAGDKAGMLAFDVDYIYYCTADYVNDTTDIWKRTAHGAGTW